MKNRVLSTSVKNRGSQEVVQLYYRSKLDFSQNYRQTNDNNEN